MQCSVCGNADFKDVAILLDALIAEWQLAPEEVNYINRQRGTHCTNRGANLRSIALADVIFSGFASDLTFATFISTSAA